MIRATLSTIAIAIALAACGPRVDEAAKPPAKPTTTKARKCPDPDNRDSRDPCSVAYIKRTPPRFSEDALK